MNMEFAFSFLQKPHRSRKPRQTGVTMALDKNLSVGGLEAVLSTSAEFIDVMKFGWCTSAIMSHDIVREKCELLQKYEVAACPGGTLLELAFLQGKIPQMLSHARELGFICIEVSNGIIPMRERDKLDCIKRALDAGFRVISEVGSKIAEEDRRLRVEDRISQTLNELKEGVWKVIVEARESGTLGIYDPAGKIDVSTLDELCRAVGVDSLLFEAPLKHQQVELILKLGKEVNLGNVAPQELVSLETLRLGMRGDTMRHFHLALPQVRIELGPSGALVAAERGDVIIVIDAIRASSTIITALANGVKCVRPVATAEECVGEITVGERGGKKIAQVDYDNSPLVFNSGRLRGKEVVLTSSNGTECILAAGSGQKAIVLIGALLNASSVAQFALETARTTGRGISILIAGRNNQAVTEDVIAASEIALTLRGAPIHSDISLITSDDFVLDFLNSASGRSLSALGRSEDVIFCARKDVFDIVPIFQDRVIMAASEKVAS